MRPGRNAFWRLGGVPRTVVFDNAKCVVLKADWYAPELHPKFVVGHTVYDRSLFDTVHDFWHDEALEGHEKVLQRYLKPDLLILDNVFNDLATVS